MLVCCVLGAMQPLGATGLSWERESARVSAQPGQRVVKVDFRFRNAGDRTINIVSIETSCRCLSAEAAKTSYGPGEKGDIAVSVSIGAQTENQEKSIVITTDEPLAKPVRLVLQVEAARSPGPAH